MFRGYNLKQKEVVNIKTAERLGRISDVEISESTGNIEAIIVPRKGCCLARLFGGGELVIPWSAIEVVGEDLVLVRFFDIDNEKKYFKIKGNDAKVAVIPDGLGVVVNI